jgi:hypothetical protein
LFSFYSTVVEFIYSQTDHNFLRIPRGHYEVTRLDYGEYRNLCCGNRQPLNDELRRHNKQYNKTLADQRRNSQTKEQRVRCSTPVYKKAPFGSVGKSQSKTNDLTKRRCTHTCTLQIDKRRSQRTRRTINHNASTSPSHVDPQPNNSYATADQSAHTEYPQNSPPPQPENIKRQYPHKHLFSLNRFRTSAG